MCRFIESICFEKGNYPLLALHQKRLNLAFATHFPGQAPHGLSKILPDLDFEEKYKVRLVYNATQTSIEFSPYEKRQVHQIKLIENDEIEYAHKYEDRTELQAMFDQKAAADEIIIVKNGMVTDSFYANPVFWDGQSWFTPRTYLLNGIRRQHLLNTGKITETTISKKDLISFEKVSLVNALVNLGELVVPVSSIK